MTKTYLATVSQTRNQAILPRLVPAEVERSAPPEGVLDVYDVEFDYLYRTLVRFGIPQADLEDVVHEVFVVLCRKWENYDPSRPLRPYLFGIAFRVAAAHRRRNGREVPTDDIDVPDGARSAECAVRRGEARATVLAALERVALARRAVFIMHDLDEVPMTTIAQTLGIPLFTAYSRLRKARKEFERAVRQLHSGGRP